MKKKIWILISLIVLGGFGFWFFNNSKSEMVSPKSEQGKSAENFEDKGPVGGQKVPKEFKFEASSDLNAELENINPEVLDSDFTELKTLLKDF